MSYPKHEEVLSLRSFDSWLDRFCAKHRNLAVPNLMLYIVIGNVIVFVLDMFSRYSFSHMLTFVPLDAALLARSALTALGYEG